jgi:exosortase
VATGALLAPAFAHAFVVWSTTPEFSFGFLVIPTSVGLLWWERNQIRASMAGARGAPSGLVLVIASLTVYFAAWRMDIHALAGLSVPPLLCGMLAYLFGWRVTRPAGFPIGFLAFGLGLFRGLMDTLGFALQGVTAFGAEVLAHMLGIPVARDGLVLASDRFAFIVAESCSGMSSFVSLLALATLWTYASRGSVSARAVVVMSAFPLVVLANSARVALVLLVATWFGQDTALGFFHGASSLVLFGMSVVGMLVVSRSTGCSVFRRAH